MCGIAGIFNYNGKPVDTYALERMANALKHRGPDDEGYFLKNTSDNFLEERQGIDTVEELKQGKRVIEEANRDRYNLGLVHRRLSILDLSAKGHQPMCSEDGNVWLVFNGEIYNYVELAGQLAGRGHTFRSKTDAEVLIHLYEEKGVDCLDELNGMFAFAIWDNRSKTLFCARDRFGVKPFYYHAGPESFTFASEIKALFAAGVRNSVNEFSVLRYLHDGAMPYEGETFFEKVEELRPGHMLLAGKKMFRVEPWYELKEKYMGLSYEESVKRYRELFLDSVRLRLRSDMPVGTCLSGGLDSSSIACVASTLLKEERSSFSQKAFSVCFQNKKYDESSFIALAAKQASLQSLFIQPEAKQALDKIEELVLLQEEPFGSLSVFAQYEVMKLAKKSGVTVLLDGQGGDEFLAGYNDYYHPLFAALLRKGNFPRLAKELLAYKKGSNGSALTGLLGALKLSLPYKEELKMMLGMRQHFKPWVLDGGSFLDNRWVHAERYNGYLRKHLFVSINSYLPELLRYEDRNSMGQALETRLPFLDYRLAEFTFSLPDEYKIKDAVSKRVLRDAMKGTLPEEIRTRKDKMGFVTPEALWYKDELKNSMKDIIGAEDLVTAKYLNKENALEYFKAFEAGKHNDHAAIWRFANLKLWHKVMVEDGAGVKR